MLQSTAENHINNELATRADSSIGLQNTFKNKANIFYSNPIIRPRKVKDFLPPRRNGKQKNESKFYTSFS